MRKTKKFGRRHHSVWHVRRHHPDRTCEAEKSLLPIDAITKPRHSLSGDDTTLEGLAVKPKRQPLFDPIRHASEVNSPDGNSWVKLTIMCADDVAVTCRQRVEKRLGRTMTCSWRPPVSS